MSEACFSSKNGNRTSGIFYQRASFCCVFLWAKGLNAMDIHTKMFPAYDGKCLSRKAFATGSKNSLKNVRNSQLMPDQVRKRLRQQSKDLYAAGFEALVKRWDKCINVGGGYVEI
jgi:predicted peroxiredoxin